MLSWRPDRLSRCSEEKNKIPLSTSTPFQSRTVSNQFIALPLTINQASSTAQALLEPCHMQQEKGEQQSRTRRRLLRFVLLVISKGWVAPGQSSS